VARLVPIQDKPHRQFGSAKGLITIAEDFDAPLEGFKELTS
jgi:antitoxin (DNA-binding transcriptional repressor) of toxin-antitoxin stability system